MKTNRDILAQAFPLHFQRICECIYADRITEPTADQLNAYLDKHMQDATLALECAFIWVVTDEGADYWRTLADGASYANAPS